MTVLVREASRLSVEGPALTTVVGNVTDSGSLKAAFQRERWDAVVNVVGADPLKPSTLVTDTARQLVPLAEASGITRYLAITGTAEMPKTLPGMISSAFLRLTPVGNAVRDHDGAFATVKASGLDWALIGCPWIKDGPATGRYQKSEVFPGGMKTIHPGDVAAALYSEISNPKLHRQILGIWY